LSNARSLAASTFTTLGEIKPALKSDNLVQSSPRDDAFEMIQWHSFSLLVCRLRAGASMAVRIPIGVRIEPRSAVVFRVCPCPLT
jgi:hypothetical protein